MMIAFAPMGYLHVVALALAASNPASPRPLLTSPSPAEVSKLSGGLEVSYSTESGFDFAAHYPAYDQESESLLTEVLTEAYDAQIDELDVMHADPSNPANVGTASTPSTSQGGAVLDPTEDTADLKLNLDKMAEFYGYADYTGLFKPEGRGALLATAFHEAGHVCTLQEGLGCDAATDSALGDCTELAAEMYALAQLCKKADELCMKICEAKDEADDEDSPGGTETTDEEQEKIDELEAELQGVCKAADTLRDKKINTEDTAELLCVRENIIGLPDASDPCAFIDFTNTDCPDFTLPDAPDPPDGGGDGMAGDDEWEDSPRTPDDCDFPNYPEGAGPDIAPPCAKCNEDGSSKCPCSTDNGDGGDGLPGDDGGQMLPEPRRSQAQTDHIRLPNFAVNFLRAYSPLMGSTGGALIHSAERETATGVWHLSSRYIRLGYRPVQVSARTSHDVYVMGFSERSDTWVLEQISVGQPDGGYRTLRTASTVAQGEAYATPVTITEIKGSSGFIAPESRSTAADRRVIAWSAPAATIQQVDRMVIDPDGRFAVVYDSGLGKVHRIGIQPGEADSVLSEAHSIPGLDCVAGLRFVESTTYGRVLTISYGSCNSSQVGLFIDAGNDGSFDGLTMVDNQDFLGPNYKGTFYRNFQAW